MDDWSEQEFESNISNRSGFNRNLQPPQHIQNNQQQKKDYDNKQEWDNNKQDNNWMTNNRRNDRRPGPGPKRNDRMNDLTNNRNQNQRKSRFDLDRSRDRRQDNIPRAASRDNNNSWDSFKREPTENLNDGHNYRFQNEKNSQEPDLDRLNSILHPKPLQFKGSFNKKSNVTATSTFPQRSQSRDANYGIRSRSRSNNRNNNIHSHSRSHTPTSNVDFDQTLLPPPGDARPCYYILKKVMELDAEATRVHDKIHGIDKVISSLQTERVGYQKTLTRLQHDRKVLFENLMKKAVTSEHNESNNKVETSIPSPVPTSHKAQMNRKLQDIVDKKRKHDDPMNDEPKPKKPVQESKIVQEPKIVPTSSKVDLRQKEKEKEEEERKKRLLEKKRIKQLRREREMREEAERTKASLSAQPITIKQEPIESDKNKSKSTKIQVELSHRSHEKKHAFMRRQIKYQNFIKSHEILHIDNYKLKHLRLTLNKVPLARALADRFKLIGSLEIEIDDWNRWSKPVKVETKVTFEKPAKLESEPAAIEEDPLLITECDPFADIDVNPPTPGSGIQSNGDDSMLIEVVTEPTDYSEWTGSFIAHEQPIVHLQNINGKYVVCATEDGKLYKYQLSDGKLAAVFSKHTEICNMFLYDERGGSSGSSILSVSSDGNLYRIRFKSFQLNGNENFNEPLQVIEKSKTNIYVGSKSGRIYRLKADLSDREDEPLCDLGTLILCLRASKEGSRNILLVSSKTNAIQVRDANDGLLLRTLSQDLAGVSIYDMLLEGSTIYCGSSKNEIFAVDFTTGALKKSRPCGAGAICVKLFKNYLIAACYDGNIYVFNTNSEDDAVNISGPGNMLLSMDLWDDKIIASTKDKALKIMNIPT